MKPLTYTIIEHQSFGIDEIGKVWKEQKGKEYKGIEGRAKKFFQALEEFQKTSEDHSKFLKHSSKHKLKAQNYVGVIQTKHGTLEILPKCFREDALQVQERKKPTQEDRQKHKKDLAEFYEIEHFQQQFNPKDKQDSQDTRNQECKIKIESFKLINTPQKSAQAFLIHCLSFFKQNLIKKSQISSIDTCNTPLLDVFMQMFCQELLEVCKKGIRHDYVAIEDNRSHLKGKLLFSGQIRHNLVHKERFYTSSDEHIANIAQNRLIKSTLELIASKATFHTTLTLVNQCLEIFEEIPRSNDPQADFLSCTSSRHFNYYDNLLEWCRLFLDGNSFSAYSGESKAYALLFPMEKLFESYVAHMLKKHNNTDIQTQSSSHYLLHSKEDSKLFQLKPDLCIKIKDKNTEEEKIVIADTKWKVLKNAEDKKHGIDQSDLYQLFAYAHYHKAHEVWLIYPKLYAQDESNQSEKNEILKIFQNLKKWDEHHYGYYHPCSLEGKNHQIKIKILLAPLAFH